MNEYAFSPAAQAVISPLDSSQPESADVFDMLIPELRRATELEGYITPTPIQQQCIPHLLEGRDLLGCAQTGTGKTAAFVLPILQRLARDAQSTRPCRPRVLVLAPTRELAAQIGQSINTYGRFLRLRHTVVFGGVNQNNQVRALKRGVELLVATPGRLLDLMQQGFIQLDAVNTFVLDEMDRMLDMGFIPDIKRILAVLPAARQTAFFSATMAPKIVELAGTMVQDPVQVTITPEKLSVERIAQKVLFVDKQDKNDLLVSLLKETTVSKAIVFTQMKHAADRVVKKLDTAGIRGIAIHGNKSQAARTRALDGFRNGRFRVLVATDVAARGLDVDDVTHVINYDMPVEAETYVHRIGRTARAGAEGDAISLCCSEDGAYLREIETLLGQTVPSDLEHEYHSENARRSRQSGSGVPSRRKGAGTRYGRPTPSRSSSRQYRRRR